MDELIGEFVSETRETLERIAGALIAWEVRPEDPVQLDEIFRFVHTVKGSCGFLDLPRIAALAHAAESVLDAVRCGSRMPTAGLVAAILSIIDRIARLVDALETGIETGDDDAPLLAALDRGEAPSAATGEEAAQPNRTIRIGVPLLETMMTQVSELVLARNDLARAARRLGDSDLDARFDRVSAIVANLRDSVTRTRMQPIDRLFATLPRLVRDTARACGKSVTLELVGQDVEIDREMVEAIRDPLVHIVRNAIDHGIEAAADRTKAGKPETSVLRILAYQSGNQVSIEVADDGRGIDTARLVAKAVSAKIVEPARAALLDEGAAAALIFEPGLSTAANVTEISGRGVGMDVVRANVERLGGCVVVDNRPGLGLSVTLRAPLTLSIVTALVVRVGDQRFAIPRGAIEEIVSLDQGKARVERVGNATVAVVREAACPALVVATLFGINAAAPKFVVMISTATGGRFALAVDAVDDHEELVVRPMAPQLVASGLFAGQSLGDDGQPVLVLDTVGLAARAKVARALPGTSTETPNARAPSILCATGFDGQQIAVRAMLVERLVTTQARDWSTVGTRRFVALDGRHMAAATTGGLPGDGEIMAVILTDGLRRVALAVAGVSDLVPCPETVPVGEAGIEAWLRIGDADVALLDAGALLDGAVAASVPARVARIALDDTPWVRGILAPMLEASGYTLAFGSAIDADLAIHLEGEAAPSAARAVALARDARGGVDLARYDRAALRSLLEA